MRRFLLVVTFSLATIACFGARAAAQSYSDLFPGRAGTVTFTLNGRSHTASAKAYMTNGRLFINGIWVEDSTVKFGRAGLSSTFMLRVRGMVGEQLVGNDPQAGTMLSLHYGGDIPSRMYQILRTDRNGGGGKVSITSITEDHALGTFEFTAYDLNNPGTTKSITGNFDVEFKRIGELPME